jgi:hypothetical protein
LHGAVISNGGSGEWICYPIALMGLLEEPQSSMIVHTNIAPTFGN